MPKLVVVLYGRFQPPHRGHLTVFKTLGEKFGSKNVYLGTSDKTDPDRSPLTFQQKKKLLVKQGIPADRILKTRRNYNAEEIKQALNIKEFSDFIYIVAVGKKDSNRLSGGKFYQKLSKGAKLSSLDTADTRGYFTIIPNITVGGTPIHASSIRDTLRKPELEQDDINMLMNMTGFKQRDVVQLKRLFEFAHRRKWWSMLVEGGAAGHMTHPFEDLDMSFSELKNLINLAFEGKLQVASEGPITEKIDGQNLFASVIGGKVRFARNKGQLKNRGKTSMTTLDIDRKWKEIPHVRSAFMKAAQTLETGLEKLPKKTQKEIFKDGENWVNFELVAQENPNVINYDTDVIIFHNIHMVDESGNKIGMASRETQKLFKLFSKAEKSAELKMRIQPPQIVKVQKNLTIDFKSDQQKFMQDINKISRSAKLSDKNTLEDLLRVNWEKELDKLENKHTFTIDKKTRKKLIDRFATGDKSYRVTDWPKDIPDGALIDSLKKLDSESIQFNKKILEPVELLVLRFGVVLLQNIDTFISANPDDSIKQLRQAIAQQIATIKKSKDVATIDKMTGILQKIDKLGGFKGLVPSEGIVFKYKGKIYKITGLFAPVNQLMGLIRFSR